jgi:hypothetical protein
MSDTGLNPNSTITSRQAGRLGEAGRPWVHQPIDNGARGRWRIGCRGGFGVGVVLMFWGRGSCYLVSVLSVILFPLFVTFDRVPKIALRPLIIVWVGYGLVPNSVSLPSRSFQDSL